MSLVDLVPFLFGAARREELPGPVLVRLLTEAGVPVATARTTLTRLRERGGLTTERAGRHVVHRLAGATLAGFRRVGLDRPEPEWDGTFHGVLYTVPESARAYRDMLRRSALVVGYGHLRAGLLIAPHDAWTTLGPQLGPPPEGARVAPLELRLAPDDARTAAAEAWDLPAAAAALHREAERVRGGLGGTPRPDGATLRAYHELLRPAFRTLLWAPSLAAQLLPADWPRAELQAAIGEAGAHYQPAATAYLDELLAPFA